MRRCVLLVFASVILALGVQAKDQTADLVEVEKFIPGIVLDIRYATTNNFMGKVVYSSPKCFLRKSTAKKLKAAQNEFQKMGLRIKIYDGYRPLSAQRKLWEIVPDERYVANPAKGSKHNRGGAVDITLVNREGQELLMPTGYDDFSEKAHRDYKNLPEEAIRHRELLRYIMQKHGFKGISHEWWHFDDLDWKNYEILDVDIADVESAGNNATK